MRMKWLKSQFINNITSIMVPECDFVLYFTKIRVIQNIIHEIFIAVRLWLFFFFFTLLEFITITISILLLVYLDTLILSNTIVQYDFILLF